MSLRNIDIYYFHHIKEILNEQLYISCFKNHPFHTLWVLIFFNVNFNHNVLIFLTKHTCKHANLWTKSNYILYFFSNFSLLELLYLRVAHHQQMQHRHLLHTQVVQNLILWLLHMDLYQDQHLHQVTTQVTLVRGLLCILEPVTKIVLK